jgi:5'-deoxynucleotidase YfbR-like HD superfamily hydrolase
MTTGSRKSSRKVSDPPAPRAWQRMLSGRRLDLLDPSPLDIEIADIAHGLARVARWNGQTRGGHAFSVAQHSVLVESLVRRMWPESGPAHLLGALLHDAPEYVIGDMISPFKNALGVDYRQFEARLESAIRLRFGLPAKMTADLKARIKQADQSAAFYEATRLAGFDVDEALGLFGGPPPGPDPDMTPLSPSDAQQLFLQRFSDLQSEMDGRG